MEQRLSRLEERFRSLVGFVTAVNTSMVDFMAARGLFSAEERSFLIREIERLASLCMSKLNPLKPEEAKFILEVVREIRKKSPKEVDMEKLERALQIAYRVFMEDGTYEAAKLWISLYTLKRIIEKERGEL